MSYFSEWLTTFLFRFRFPVLLFMFLVTVLSLFQFKNLGFDVGFEKTLPSNHPYVQTFLDYRKEVGVNNLLIALQAPEGKSIWNKDFFQRYKSMTDVLFYMPSVDRVSVTSLWTPNLLALQATEMGIQSKVPIPTDTQVENLTLKNLAKIRGIVNSDRWIRQFVSKKENAALIRATLFPQDPKTGQAPDYFRLAMLLEDQLRTVYEKEGYRVLILGFTKQVGDIAEKAGWPVYGTKDGAPWYQTVVNFLGTTPIFFLIAFMITALLLYIYTGTIHLTLVAMGCSLLSVVWQFGLLTYWGYQLDPLAVLTPFLVFAVGLSHAVQQINYILRRAVRGKLPRRAARSAMRSLFLPGMMALLTDVVGFASLAMIDIPLIRHMALTASVGIFFQMFTILMLLPLLTSYMTFSQKALSHFAVFSASRELLMQQVARIPRRFSRRAMIMVCASILFVGGLFIGGSRSLGTTSSGVPELFPDARYNQDIASMENLFGSVLNTLMIIIETPADSCVKYPYLDYMDRLSWYMKNQPSVVDVISLVDILKHQQVLWQGDDIKWETIPRDPSVLARSVYGIPTTIGLHDERCRYMSMFLFIKSMSAHDIDATITALEAYQDFSPPTLGDIWIASVPYLTPGDAIVPFNEGERTTLTYDTNRFTPEQVIATLEREAGKPFPSGTYKPQEPNAMKVRLASGNVGIQAAVNDILRASEVPMMLMVYGIVLILLGLAYRSWRGVVACIIPLALATSCGYAFMFLWDIGLTIATLPVMALSVGLGVDYSFYIYNGIHQELLKGKSPLKAVEKGIGETGVAIFFTSLILSLGILVWNFSGLKLQADMGILLPFMFISNMLGAIILLPVLVIFLHKEVKD